MYAKPLSIINEVADGEFPFYEMEPEEPKKQKERPILWKNADTLANYKLSRASAPSPNTLVPVGSDGKLPASIIPVVVGTNVIYSRDGLTAYTLYVEVDGALSYDPA